MHASEGKAPSSDRYRHWTALAIYGLFFLFLFIVCSPTLDSQFDLPKIVVLRTGAFALSMLALLNYRRISGGGLHPFALCLSLALGSWWIISIPFALHMPTALNGEYDRFFGLWTHLCWLALFCASIAVPGDTITVRRIVTFLTVAIVAVAVINICELNGLTAFGLGEVSSLGDRVAASALMNFAIPFVVIALVRARNRGLKAGMGCLFALLLVSEFLSQGRGPWIGLLVAMPILLSGLIRTRPSWKVALAVISGMIIIAGITITLSPMVAERFATFKRITRDESVHQRFIYYKAALRAVREHPVAGVGFENFRNSYPLYRTAEDQLFFQNAIPTMVHNGYLQTALSNGIPALLLYLALTGTVLVMIVRRLSSEKDPVAKDLLLGILAALTAYLVQDLSGWLDLSIASAFWIMLGLALNMLGRDNPHPPLSWTKPAIAAFFGLMVLLSPYLIHDGYVRLVVDAQLFEAQSLDVKAQWPEAESLVNRSLLGMPGDSRTELIAGQIYAKRFVVNHDPTAFARSRELFESSYRHNRFDRVRLFNIILLEVEGIKTGRIAAPSDFTRKAIDVLSETDHDNPGFHEVRARYFAVQGLFPEALTAIREALRLAPQAERFRAAESEYLSRMKPGKQ